MSKYNGHSILILNTMLTPAPDINNKWILMHASP
jgi:hypothetical protein